MPVSSSTTGAAALYEVTGGLLGSDGQRALELAGGTRTVSLRSDDGTDELNLTLSVRYDNYRPERGEMWFLVPAQRGTSLPTYAVVPVHVAVTTADTLVTFAIERAELVSAENERAAIEHVHGGRFTGSFDRHELESRSPACGQVGLLVDFRRDEVRARLQVQNELNHVCKRWQTAASPLPWGALLASE